MTATEVVLDASAFVRGVHRESEAAADLLDAIARGTVLAHAPDLIGAETANALLRLHRAGRLTLADATEALEVLETLPLERHSTLTLAASAVERAAGSTLSAYDAFYAVLAEALGAPLVTADRRLAGEVDGATLVGSTRGHGCGEWDPLDASSRRDRRHEHGADAVPEGLRLLATAAASAR